MIRAYVSIQASVSTLKNQEQARKMLTSTATGGDRGVFDYTGKYFEAGRTFLASGKEPSFPSRSFFHMKDATMDRLLKVNGEKRFIGDNLPSKVKRDRNFKTCNTCLR